MSCRFFQKYGTCRYEKQCKFEHTLAPQVDRSGRRPPSPTAAADSRSYIQDFFDQYPSFDYYPFRPVMDEFYRMWKMFHWSSDNETKIIARLDLGDAMTLQFNEIYGEDENSFEAWKNLCVVLNIGNVPNDLETCRKLVASMFVNIVDLIDTPVTKEEVVKFASEEALREYSKATGKYFPAENAYAGGLLKFLLRKTTRADRGKIMKPSVSKPNPRLNRRHERYTESTNIEANVRKLNLRLELEHRYWESRMDDEEE